jgi:hypothetical protein
MATCPICSAEGEVRKLRTVSNQAAAGEIDGRKFKAERIAWYGYVKCEHVCEERQYVVSDGGEPLARDLVRAVHPQEVIRFLGEPVGADVDLRHQDDERTLDTRPDAPAVLATNEIHDAPPPVESTIVAQGEAPKPAETPATVAKALAETMLDDAGAASGAVKS